MNNVWILAQAPGTEASDGIGATPVTEYEQGQTLVSDSNMPPAQKQVRRNSGYSTLLLMALMFAVMYLLLFRGPRKKQQKQRQMVQSLKRNDRVQTIGGIIGTIVDVKDNEVTLKIDESNNTKIKIMASAIGKNFSQEKD